MPEVSDSSFQLLGCVTSSEYVHVKREL